VTVGRGAINRQARRASSHRRDVFPVAVEDGDRVRSHQRRLALRNALRAKSVRPGPKAKAATKAAAKRQSSVT